MEEFATYREVLLFVVALYGAVLSTFNWIYARRKERRAIRVTLDTAIPTYGAEFGRTFARVEATNVGHRPVSVTRLAIETSKGRLQAIHGDQFPGLRDTPLPATLSDGQSAQLYMSYYDIASALVRAGLQGTIKLVPVCEDSAGGVHKGEPWEVTPDSLLDAAGDD